jgi:hypothetical protein
MDLFDIGPAPLSVRYRHRCRECDQNALRPLVCKTELSFHIVDGILGADDVRGWGAVCV